MCLSPHEMTSARIEEIIETMKRYAEEATDPLDIDYWNTRIEQFEKLLKERAEDGTYATAGK